MDENQVGKKQEARQTPPLVAVEWEQKAAQKANAIEGSRWYWVEAEELKGVLVGCDATTLQALIAVLERG